MKKILTLASTISFLLFALKVNAQCTAPANLQTIHTNNVTTFTWDAVPGAVSYGFHLGWAGANWGATPIIVNTNSFSLTGLVQGMNYQWHVRTNCTTDTSTYTETFFSTECTNPFNLTTTNVSTTSAQLNWSQLSNMNTNNTGFSLSYRLAGTQNTWTPLGTVNGATTTYNIAGLASGTGYQWRVIRTCGASNSSYIASSFTTLSCISNGTNTSEWIDLFSIGSINRVSGAETNGYVNTGLSSDLTIGSTNAGQISAGFASTLNNQRFSVFIDFNRNGSFADAGEKVVNNVTINNAGNKNFSFTIPSTATAGTTRMRVIMRRGSGSITPCITGYNGETEDYDVNLVSSNARMAQPNIEEVINEEVYKFSIYPNPSNGIIEIKSPINFDAQQYIVRNIDGSIIAKGIFNDTKMITVDLSKQVAGLYLVSIVNVDGKAQHAKVMIQ